MRHHFVPKFLLKGWAGRDGRIEVFRLLTPSLSSLRHPPKNLAWKGDLYAVDMPGVSSATKQQIETQVLQHIDDKAARVRRKLMTGEVADLTVEERLHWTRFLMSLRVRQPHNVSYVRESCARELRNELAKNPKEYEALARPEDPLTLLEFVEQERPGLIENTGMDVFAGVVSDPAIVAKIVSLRHWRTFDFCGCEDHLLLADQPCIYIRGIDDPGFVIALPIGPKRAFLATGPDGTIANLERLQKDTLLVRFNESSIGQAKSEVYALDNSPRLFVDECVAKIQHSSS